MSCHGLPHGRLHHTTQQDMRHHSISCHRSLPQCHHQPQSRTRDWPYNQQIQWQPCSYRHLHQGIMEHKMYRTHHLMHGHFSPMYPVAIPLLSQQHTRSMRHQRRENTPNMSVMWSTCGSDYHSEDRRESKNKKVSMFMQPTTGRHKRDAGDKRACKLKTY